MDAGDRVDVELVRGDDITQTDFPDALQDMFGAHRALERRHQFTTVEFGFGVPQGVFLAEYG
jgi:hypothetical protein